ncbi:MAG: hypothetical protein K2H10_01200 [Bacteroidales bacterium]|nr:hypothetical protein [Bacteroidales bacterium]
MKMVLFIIILLLFALSVFAQDDYKSIEEYKTYDWIRIKKVRLPEYAVADPGMSDELLRFAESEKSKAYYDKDAYITVRK